MPKDKTKKGQNRHNPLLKDIEESKTIKTKNRPKSEKQHQEEDFLPLALSQKLLKQVREQQEEFAVPESKGKGKKGTEKAPQQQFLELETPVESEDDEPEQDFFDGGNEIVDIDPSDEAALALFMGMGNDKPTTLDLGGLIMQKIQEKEIQVGAGSSVGADASNFRQTPSTLDPKVIAVYTQIASILHTFRSGKLPKAVKIIPLLTNWEEVLYLTKPETWSPSALHQLTRIFASNFNEKLAQRYFNLVLLPRTREDIKTNKKLNWHIYMALKKALYKPTAFYKGILLPLCEERDCTLREAIILGSVIKKISVPAVQSSVALLKIASMPYSGANSIFIRVFLEKKYALPYKVLDALVDHFLRFQTDTRKMPVIWHQALLAFAQRYKEDITAEQKQLLKHLMKTHAHPLITPEIRRELFSTKCRGEIDTNTPATGQMDLSL